MYLTINLISLIIVVYMFLKVRSLVMRERALSLHKVSSNTMEEVGIPDIVLDNDNLFEQYRIGYKHIYFRDMTLKMLIKFKKLFFSLLSVKSLEISNLEFLTLFEMRDKDKKDDAIEKMIKTMRKGDVIKASKKLLVKTILKDPMMNPEKVSKRYFYNHVTEIGLAEMLTIVYQINLGEAVKKKFQSALKKVSGLSMVTRSLQPWKTDLSKNIDISKESIFPNNPFTPDEYKNLEKKDGKTMNDDVNKKELKTKITAI